MLQVLDVKTGVIEPGESGSDKDEEDDPQPQRRNKKYTRLNTNDPSQEHLLDPVDDDELLETGRPRSSQRSKRHYQNDVSIGELLSGPLGEPILEDRPPHWFVSFDEKWLKPLLTKRHVQERNQTLAEYWREKRRKMERANQSMLHGIRGMAMDDDDYNENSDALTLNSVKGTSSGLNRLNRSTSSTSSNKVYPSTSLSRPNFGSGNNNVPSKIVIG
jgi:sodium/hydrogen exchanger-like protein 6/7